MTATAPPRSSLDRRRAHLAAVPVRVRGARGRCRFSGLTRTWLDADVVGRPRAALAAAAPTWCSPSWSPSCRGASARWPCTTGELPEPRLTAWWGRPRGEPEPLPVLRRGARARSPATTRARSTPSASTSTATAATRSPGTPTASATTMENPVVAIVSTGAPARTFQHAARRAGGAVATLAARPGRPVRDGWRLPAPVGALRAEGGRTCDGPAAQHHVPPQPGRLAAADSGTYNQA